MCNDKLSPLIKWAGGKEKEAKLFLPYCPTDFECYYEPFVGGGSVYALFQAGRYCINDRSAELIALYRSIAAQDPDFFAWMDRIQTAWTGMLAHAGRQEELAALYLRYREGETDDEGMKAAVAAQTGAGRDALEAVLPPGFAWHRDTLAQELRQGLARKLARMAKLEREKGRMPAQDIRDNIETAFMGALYTYFRTLYNDPGLVERQPGLGTALFVFIRNYAYSGMFRYNDRGQFNVPYGGMAYNRKLLDKKLRYYRSPRLADRLRRTDIECLDFEDFFRLHRPTARDFVFLDPPYDTVFSTYARNEFTRDDHARLARYLCQECPARWMLVIKSTPFIYGLYDRPGLNIRAFDKRYLVSFMNRNDKHAEHLIVTNY